MVAFLLSPEARDLRPLLVDELVEGVDLWARDRLRRAYTRLPALAPRLPFIGSLPTPPPPPVFVPGLGLVPLGTLVDKLAPELDQRDEIYLQSVGQVADAALGGASGGGLDLPAALRLLLNPSDQVREVVDALMAATGQTASRAVVQDLADAVVGRLAQRQAERLGVPEATLFPGLPAVRRLVFGC